MKPLFIALLSLGWLGISLLGHADDFREKIVKEFTPTQGPGATTLAIFNTNGFVRVEGYSGSKVIVEVEKSLSADNAEILAQGKQEFKLLFEQTGDSILAYIGEPFCSFHERDGKKNTRRGSCSNWDCCGNYPRIEYHYNLDFTVKVPYATNLYLSTVNQGDVTVKDVTGTLRTFNVNGPITLTNAKGAAEVSTINGNVAANYAASPPGNSSYYTLNGDITIDYPATLSADLQFKNTNGDFYTDFPNTEVLPMQVTKNQEGRGDGTVYKINKAASVRIGRGGNTLRLETFNGNIYVKKQN